MDTEEENNKKNSKSCGKLRNENTERNQSRGEKKKVREENIRRAFCGHRGREKEKKKSKSCDKIRKKRKYRNHRIMEERKDKIRVKDRENKRKNKITKQ